MPIFSATGILDVAERACESIYWLLPLVLLIALIKTRFVIRNYMEVRFAPFWLQRTCDAWLLSLWTDRMFLLV